MLADEAAYILRRALGPTREWGEMLSDMRRRRRDVYHHGLLLRPYGVKPTGRGKPRPVYLLRDVHAFIHEVEQVIAKLPSPGAFNTFQIEVDPTVDCPWFAHAVTPTPH